MTGSRTQKQAERYLRQFVEHIQSEGDSRLPSMRVVARSCGVSHMTMLGALRVLCNEGLLQAAPGRGTRIADTEGAPTMPASPPRPKSAEVARYIDLDLTRGTYAYGADLPSAKEMAARYGVSPPTLRAALRILEQRRLLERNGRAWRIVNVMRPSSRSTVVLITRGDGQLQAAWTTPRTRANLYELEQECIRRNVRLEIVLCDTATRRLYSLSGSRCILDNPGAAPTVLGFLIWTISLGLPHRRAVVGKVAPYDLPVAVLTESDSKAARAWAAYLPQSHIVTTSPDQQVGHDIAAHLYALGHRSVAFISPEVEVAWSRSRLGGVREVFGLDTTLLGAKPIPRPVEWRRRTQGAIERQLMRACSLSELHDDRALATVNMLRWRLREAQLVDQEAKKQQTTFRAALDAGCTAWICGNDFTAFAALEFLHGEGVAVPGEVSVTGFDNAEESLYRDLTTYDFNGRGIAQTMLSAVVAPEQWLRHHGRNAHVPVPGHVVTRLTSGPPANT